MILAIDTSTALTSVAVVDDGLVLAEERHLDARRHAEVLAPMLRDVLERAGVRADDVDAIACGVGPGPYTGLRVGIATALAVGLAWGRQVYGVCSLDAIAEAALDAGVGQELGVATDARRKEVYWARYSAEGDRLTGPLVGLPADIDVGLRAGFWAGHGVLAHPEAFALPLADAVVDGSVLFPHACWIARRAEVLLASGEGIGPTDLPLAVHGGDGEATSMALHGRGLLAPAPLYLRRPDAVEVADRPVRPS